MVQPEYSGRGAGPLHLNLHLSGAEVAPEEKETATVMRSCCGIAIGLTQITTKLTTPLPTSGAASREHDYPNFRIAALLLVWLLLSLCPANLSARGADHNEPSALLRQCLESESAMDHVSFRCVTELEDAPWPIPQTRRHGRRRESFFCHRDGARLDLSGRIEWLEKTPENSVTYRMVIGPTCAAYDQAPLSAPFPTQSIGYTTDCAKSFASYLGTFAHSASLDGYYGNLSGGRRLGALLLDAGATSLGPDETINGTPCKVVTGATKFGTATLYLDPASGYLPVRVLWEKRASDFDYPGARVGDFKREINGRAQSRDRQILRLDNVRFARVSEKWVPVSGVLRVDEVFESGYTEGTIYTFQRTDVQLAPPSKKGDFTVPYSPGTEVYNWDDTQSGIAYVWDGEKAVAAGTEFRAEEVHGSWGSTSIVPAIAWGLGGVACTVVGAVLLVRLRSPRSVP